MNVAKIVNAITSSEYYSRDKHKDAEYVEIFATKKFAEKEVTAGGWNLWDIGRIQRAFNFGDGTIKDFKEYAKNNRQFATFINLKTFEVL